MSYAGGSAANMGMDVQKASTILGVFADANISGGRAGTTFNAMFKDLTSKTKNGSIQIGKTAVSVYDITGKIRDMGSVMTDVESATKGMTDAQKDSALQAVFQGQSMQGVNAFLSQGSEKYKQLEKAIYDSEGAASYYAGEMEDNIGGAFRGMGSAIEGFMIGVGDVFKDDVRTMADGIGTLASKFGNLDEETQRNIVKMIGLGAAIGPVLIGGGKLLKFAADIPAKMEVAKTGLKVLSGAINPVTIGMGALVLGGVLLYKNWGTISQWAKDKGAEISKDWQHTKDRTVQAWKDMTQGISDAMGSIKEGWNNLVGIFKKPAKGTVDITRNTRDVSIGKSKIDGSHATGLARVPFNNYKANLHENEEILRADDPRNQNNPNFKPNQRPRSGGIVFNPVYNIELSGSATEKDKQEIEKVIDTKTRELFNIFFKEMNMKMA